MFSPLLIQWQARLGTDSLQCSEHTLSGSECACSCTCGVHFCSPAVSIDHESVWCLGSRFQDLHSQYSNIRHRRWRGADDCCNTCSNRFLRATHLPFMELTVLNPFMNLWCSRHQRSGEVWYDSPCPDHVQKLHKSKWWTWVRMTVMVRWLTTSSWYWYAVVLHRSEQC